MKPRKETPWRTAPTISWRFNEAEAMKPRKGTLMSAGSRTSTRFNEAEAMKPRKAPGTPAVPVVPCPLQ